MDRNRHHSGAFCSLGVERLELILGAAEELLRLVVLKNHDRYVIQLYGIREGEKRAMGGLDLVRLVVVDPVGDILQSSLGQMIESLPFFGEHGTEPAPPSPSRTLPHTF